MPGANTYNAPEIDECDGYSLGGYRVAVAKLVKLLIRARHKAAGRFLSDDELNRWFLPNIDQDGLSVEMLLTAADRAYDELWRTYIGPNGSGGINTDDPLAELKDAVVHFAFDTSPRTVLNQLRDGKNVDWPRIANWESLATIRDWLDRLPSGEEQERELPAIVLGANAGEVVANKKKFHVTPAQFDVLKSLIAAFPDTMTKDRLANESRHTDAVNVLKRVARKHPALEPAIKMAEVTGGGYGIRPAHAD